MFSKILYKKDPGDFLNKLKELASVPQNALLLTVDVAGLYPSIPHQEGLDALSKVRATRT